MSSGLLRPPARPLPPREGDPSRQGRPASPGAGARGGWRPAVRAPPGPKAGGATTRAKPGAGGQTRRPRSTRGGTGAGVSFPTGYPTVSGIEVGVAYAHLFLTSSPLPFYFRTKIYLPPLFLTSPVPC